MNKISKFFFLLNFVVVGLSTLKASGAGVSAVNNELVVSQMNTCINILTNINNNKSLAVLDHESDQLLNNLTMQQIVGLPEIKDWRVDLVDAITKLEITQEERNLLNRISSIQQNSLKWQAFNNALNNTMLVTGGGNTGIQLGFQALLTGARTAVEYKTTQNDMQVAQLQAMWELRKEDIKTILELRKRAFDITYSLYKKYNLKESDRLTEQTAQQFNQIISGANPAKMVRQLTDNYAKFSHLADYYYYLGMGYIDTKNIRQGLLNLNKYESLYKKAPIYRINEKLGIISLTRLAYIRNLKPEQIEREIKSIRENLPSNAMAVVQCAFAYARLMNNPQKGLSLLRIALDDNSVTDKAAIILAASTLMPKVPNNTQVYKDFLSAYSNQRPIDLDAALNVCMARGYDIFKFLKNKVVAQKIGSRVLKVGDYKIKDKIKFYCSKRYVPNISNIRMYVEDYGEDEVKVSEYGLEETGCVKLSEINKKNEFKQNPNLKYLFFNSLGGDKFKVKSGLNYNSILDGTFARLDNFTLTDKDRKDIVKFLQKQGDKSSNIEVVAKKYKTYTNKTKNVVKQGVNYTLVGQAYNAVKTYLRTQNKVLVKFTFNGSRKLLVCYKFDKKNGKLVPCYTQYQGKTYFANSAIAKEFGVGAKPAAKKVVKSAAKPATKAAAKPAAKPTAKPATKTVAKPAAKPATKVAAKPAAKPAVKSAGVKSAVKGKVVKVKKVKKVVVVKNKKEKPKKKKKGLLKRTVGWGKKLIGLDKEKKKE